MYSFSMSAWTVPLREATGTPVFLATPAYMHVRTEAGALIVIEVLTLSRGIPRKITSMSLREETLTPHLPTSPWAFSWSASYP